MKTRQQETTEMLEQKKTNSWTPVQTRIKVTVAYWSYFVLFYFFFKLYMYINKPAYIKIYNKTCATSENSAQPAHLRSLIKVIADCISLSAFYVNLYRAVIGPSG